jgi:WD40 repeat protein
MPFEAPCKLPEKYWYFASGSVGTDLTVALPQFNSHEKETRLYEVTGLKVEPAGEKFESTYYEDILIDKWDSQNVGFAVSGESKSFLQVNDAKFEGFHNYRCLTGRIAASNSTMALFDVGCGKLVPIRTIGFREWFRTHAQLSDNVVLASIDGGSIIDMRTAEKTKYMDMWFKTAIFAGSRLFINAGGYKPASNELEFEQVGQFIWNVITSENRWIKAMHAWHPAAGSMVIVTEEEESLPVDHDWDFEYQLRILAHHIYLVDPHRMTYVKVATITEDFYAHYYATSVAGLPVFCGIKETGAIDVIIS